MDVRGEILEYMSRNNLSQARAARLIGIGESTFSRYLKEDYPNPSMVEEKIVDLLEKEKLRRETRDLREIGFAMTNVSRTVLNVLDYCRIQRTIGVIYGDAGIGKTRTMQEWAKGRPNVVILTAAPALNSPNSFLKYLGQKLRTIKACYTNELYVEIMERLMGTDMVVIVDEAQHLSIKTLENLRSLQDATGIALILIGNELVYTKMVGRQQAEFAQLFSRIGIRKHLMTDQFELEDVKKVFGELEREIAELLLAVCRSKYGLRGAVHVYVNANNNDDLTVKGIRAMARMMGIII